MNIQTSQSAAETLPGRLWIGGAWCDGRGGDDIEVIDPSTETVIASVANASVADGIAAVDAAAAAAAGWAATAPRVRGEILRRAYEIMTARAESVAALISRENGKALADARGEVAYAAEFFRWYAEEAMRLAGELGPAPSGAYNIMVRHEPIGIALLVTPWNFPAAMATRKIGPALAAGCTCILKPATETPLTALVLAEILAEAGVPPGVVNVVTTRSAGKLTSAILRDPRVRKLSFTGSTEVGRILLREAAEQVVSCSMELGGNAPFIVFEDADLNAALDGAMVAKMRNGGEACTAANRFYVHETLYERFVDGLAARMGALRVDDGGLAATQCGPLINRAAVANTERLVRDAVAVGATVLTGGKALDRPGYFYAPTVLANVPAHARVMREEIFAPVAPIASFTTEDEAIERANDTEYGLISYLYTGDLARGLRVSARLQTGMVGLNRGVVSDPAAPFGGMKASGLGREGGHHGILEYIEPKYTAVTW
ncbi:succinate-semialdehyde dehydrogenase/glutarate-semialdehyde dehydrogenase [Amaricoccus macauensis]|uniref:Succinate-semialdehyde dehydrogenase/glutarate-semialdehyde dehydrogenase n=1 Tax=Amaricoccus macauensis TaxID=57001 RepID=A0A840SSR3_9RHOB|nr:NAD-dependent succinate-semialdehyde dehydrogenase [Amaricoccus macauensis]MBB5224214.1 succinate-semialdehyde dehydrogenase/glutarate-semialdehyde dehydrogenase [Amaricoccus macauensis]